MDDIPSPGNCLYGSFIYSTKPFARVKGIKFSSKSLPDGVTAVISFKDIPKGGQNVGLEFSFGPEPLFAEELTQYAGEPVAFVVTSSSITRVFTNIHHISFGCNDFLGHYVNSHLIGYGVRFS